MIFGANSKKKIPVADSKWIVRAALLGALFILALSPPTFGQSPFPAATGPAKDNPGGFTRAGRWEPSSKEVTAAATVLSTMWGRRLATIVPAILELTQASHFIS